MQRMRENLSKLTKSEIITNTEPAMLFNARCRECGRELGENRFEEFRSAKKAIASLLRSQVNILPAAVYWY